MTQLRHHELVIRDYVEADLPALVDLWVGAWQAAMPGTDFAGRRVWFAQHFAELRVAGAHTFVAALEPAVLGFVTIDAATGYLDQLAVAAHHGRRGVGSRLLDMAKRLAAERIDLHVNTENARAIAFYEKHGFSIAGEGTNPNSGRPVYRMTWIASSRSGSEGG